MTGAPGLDRFSVTRVDTSGGLPRKLLRSVSIEEDLHKGLVGMRVPDVDHTLYLTYVVTSGMVVSYGESVDADARHEGVVHHVTFMACDGSSTGVASDRFNLGCQRGYDDGTSISLTRMLT
ncbi:hypothetical protein BHE74_00002457 [Ensete ventricosum]|nr:hypothetical protein BHE74_00002457 [Ensete ventricosum]